MLVGYRPHASGAFGDRPLVHYRAHLKSSGMYERELARAVWPDEAEAVSRGRLRNFRTAARACPRTIEALAAFFDVPPESFYSP